MLRNRNVLLLISLLIAIGLWVYVMGSVDPQTTIKISGIKVQMQGTDVLDEQELTATLRSPDDVTITIEGRRSQVNKAKKKGVEAYIDVSKCDYGDNETRIQVNMPDGVTGVSVEYISQEMAVFTVK